MRFLFLGLSIWYLFSNNPTNESEFLSQAQSPFRSNSSSMIEVMVRFEFSKKFKPEQDGHLVMGVYSDRETYDLITALDLEEIDRDNPRIISKMWDHYFRLVILHHDQRVVLQKLNLDPRRQYAITAFYDRNHNREFDILSYPLDRLENYGFSNYRKKFTWRKPDFDEIAFSPEDYREKPLVIKMHR